jgi:hypothetical protein
MPKLKAPGLRGRRFSNFFFLLRFNIFKEKTKMKTLIPFLFLFIAFVSCERNEIPEDFSPEISFEVSQFIETQIPVLNFELTPNGFYYSGYEEPRIYFSTFSGDTMSIKTESEVKSLVYDRRFRKLYIGTKSSGLGVLKGNTITYFSPDNSILPRYVIARMDVDSEGNLWIASAKNGEGGLYRFDGNEFVHFSTDNSLLTSDLIYGICCRNASVYISGKGIDGHTVFRIDKTEKGEYSWEEILSDGEYYHEIAADENDNVYVIFRVPAEGIIKLSADGTKNIITPDRKGDGFVYTKLITDKRGYLWANKISLVSSEHFSVYDGKNWHPAPTAFPENGLESIDVDENNNIWLASYSGIYILNQ